MSDSPTFRHRASGGSNNNITSGYMPMEDNYYQHSGVRGGRSCCLCFVITAILFVAVINALVSIIFKKAYTFTITCSDQSKFFYVPGFQGSVGHIDVTLCVCMSVCLSVHKLMFPISKDLYKVQYIVGTYIFLGSIRFSWHLLWPPGDLDHGCPLGGQYVMCQTCMCWWRNILGPYSLMF